MGENTKIQWCDHTFNPWWGCTKVPGDPACHNCYAEAWSKRTGQNLWGDKKPRRTLSDGHWDQPLKWNRKAAESGERPRVFCASMCDVFEDRRDLDPVRERLWALIDATPNLDWLLLTKRPENIGPMLATEQRANVWLGVTAVTQGWLDTRASLLLEHEAAVHFVSAEPLREAVDLEPWLRGPGRRLTWVIVGGESGPKARPFALDWARAIKAQCAAADVAFFCKQLGRVAIEIGERPVARELTLKDKKGGDMAEFPPDLRIRQFPNADGVVLTAGDTRLWVDPDADPDQENGIYEVTESE